MSSWPRFWKLFDYHVYINQWSSLKKSKYFFESKKQLHCNSDLVCQQQFQKVWSKFVTFPPHTTGSRYYKRSESPMFNLQDPFVVVFSFSAFRWLRMSLTAPGYCIAWRLGWIVIAGMNSVDITHHLIVGEGHRSLGLFVVCLGCLWYSSVKSTNNGRASYKTSRIQHIDWRFTSLWSNKTNTSCYIATIK